MTKLLLTRPEAAQALSISLREIDRLIAAGKVYSRRIGRRRLVPLEALRRFALSSELTAKS